MSSKQYENKIAAMSVQKSPTYKEKSTCPKTLDQVLLADMTGTISRRKMMLLT